MSRGKPVQGGVRVTLPAGVTWQQLPAMRPAQIRQHDLWPALVLHQSSVTERRVTFFG